MTQENRNPMSTWYQELYHGGESVKSFLDEHGRFFEADPALWDRAKGSPLQIELWGMPNSLKTLTFRQLQQLYDDVIVFFPPLVPQADYLTYSAANTFNLLEGLPYEETLQNYLDAVNAYYFFEHFRALKQIVPRPIEVSAILNPKLAALKSFYALIDSEWGDAFNRSQLEQLRENLRFAESVFPDGNITQYISYAQRGYEKLSPVEREIFTKIGATILHRIEKILYMFDLSYKELTMYDQIELYRFARRVLGVEAGEYWLTDARKRCPQFHDFNFPIVNNLWLSLALRDQREAFLASQSRTDSKKVAIVDEGDLSALLYLRADDVLGKVPDFGGKGELVTHLGFDMRVNEMTVRKRCRLASLMFLVPPDISLQRENGRRGPIMSEEFLQALWEQALMLYLAIRGTSSFLRSHTVAVIDASLSPDNTKLQVKHALDIILEKAGIDIKIPQL